MNIRDIMTTAVITVQPSTDVRALAQLFIEKDISGAPVVDERGTLRGIVLEESLILQDKKVHLPTLIYILNGVFPIGEERFEEEMRKIASITVEGIMEDTMKTLSPDTPVEDVATMIVEEGMHYFPVLEQGKLVGVVTKKDIVRAIAQNKIW
jgi:CBS-domain-containing membrane protein